MPDPMPAPTTSISPNLQINWSETANELADLLKGELNGVLLGAAVDLNNFAVDIANDMTRALRQGKTTLTDELRGQVKLLLEINRLRVVETAAGFLDKLLMFGMRITSMALGNVTGWLASGPVR